MTKSSMGGLAIFGLVAINILLWLLFPPQPDGREGFSNQVLGEMVSTSALILMSAAIFLANRPRWVESYFGGLDKMYRAHRITASTVGLLLLLHYFIMGFLNGRFHLQPSLAKIAFLGLQISIILALAPRIPVVGRFLNMAYHRWRVIHRLTGVFFLVGIAHALRIDNVMKLSPPVIGYVLAIAAIGAVLYLYKEIIQPFLARGLPYQVANVRKLPGSVAQVTLAPQAAPMRHRAGQFLIVRYPKTPGLTEPHPFTISSAPDEENLRLTIKGSGDYTRRLVDALSEGAEARVEGSYGRFDYRAGSPAQVWVAGGIGLTPFLSWVRDFDGQSGREIHFFYSVRNQQEALFLEELDRAQAHQPGFSFYLHDSSVMGHLTVEKIAAVCGPLEEKTVFLCGPGAMITSLKAQFIEAGVAENQIHYEEFSFR